MAEKRPALKRIFSTDYATFLSSIFIVMAVVAFLIDRLVEPETVSQELPYIVAFAVIAGIPIIVWRVMLINSAFDNGSEVTGEILSIGFFRGRGNVTYAYTVQGQQYQTNNAILRTHTTRTLQRGQKVKIVANRENPRIAFIRNIYN